jgi:hypothetical protein
MLITAFPVFTWRHEMRQEKKKPAASTPVQPQEAEASVPHQTQPRPLPRRQRAPHTPQHKPTWAASDGGTEGGNDQTVQIALGGLGGRRE